METKWISLESAVLDSCVSYPILETMISCSVRHACTTPPWIRKRSGLESSGWTIISAFGKTKKTAFCLGEVFFSVILWHFLRISKIFISFDHFFIKIFFYFFCFFSYFCWFFFVFDFLDFFIYIYFLFFFLFLDFLDVFGFWIFGFLFFYFILFFFFRCL